MPAGQGPAVQRVGQGEGMEPWAARRAALLGMRRRSLGAGKIATCFRDPSSVLPTRMFPRPQRPLSSAQRAYAAADAACLLALLGSLIAAVGQPEEWPMADAPAAASGDAEPGEGNGEGAGGADGAAAGVAGALAEAADPADGSRGGDGSHAADPAGGGQRQQQLPLAGCLRQQLQAAAAAWGVRLEISGARAVRRGGRRGARQRRQQQQQQGLAGGARGEPCLGGLPRHVPWLDAQRQVMRKAAGGGTPSMSCSCCNVPSGMACPPGSPACWPASAPNTVQPPHPPATHVFACPPHPPPCSSPGSRASLLTSWWRGWLASCACAVLTQVGGTAAAWHALGHVGRAC